VNVDKRHKFIRRIVTDTAYTHDSQHFAAVMDPANTSRDVYADWGYPSEEREAWLKANGYRNRIQRRGHRNKLLSEAQQGQNHRIAKTRARVEHAFSAMEQMGGKLIRTIGQARANFAMTMMSACYSQAFPRLRNNCTAGSRARQMSACEAAVKSGPSSQGNTGAARARAAPERRASATSIALFATDGSLAVRRQRFWATAPLATRPRAK
jgi:hypothetical protein